VIAAEWDHLPASGMDVIPLSFGQLDCQTDAAISLLLDVVTRARLSEEALGQGEAVRCLRCDPDTLDLSGAVAALRDPTVALEDVMEQLRIAAKVDGRRRPSLPEARKTSRIARLGLLRRWLLTEMSYVLGLTFHQAKGKEWQQVDVALDRRARDALANGLDPRIEDHRKIYVGSTRGISTTRLRRL